MQDIIKTFAAEHLFIFAIIIVICASAIVVAMTVDLISGIAKAKENHVARTSTGYKKTCAKTQKYFMSFICNICVDLIAACANIPIPIFSILWSGYCVFCEFTSVREKSWQKAEIQKQERTMRVILENKDDIAKILAELQKEKEEKEEEKRE